MMEENTPQFQSASVNTKAANGQHSTRSAKKAITQGSMTNSGANTSSLTDKEKQPVKMAAVLFRSTVLALWEEKKIQIAKDKDGNMVLVLPQKYWDKHIKLIEAI